MDKSKENWICHRSGFSVGGGPKVWALVTLQFSSQNWFQAQSVPCPSEAGGPPNTSSESEAKVIADVPISHPWLPLNNTLYLILERKRRQDRSERNKIRQHMWVTSQLVDLGQREVWKSFLGLREIKLPHPGP